MPRAYRAIGRLRWESSGLVSLATRIRYTIFRSPLAPAIKSWRRLRARREIAARDRLGARLDIGPDAQALAADLNREGHATLDSIIDADLLNELHAAAHAKLAQSGTPSGSTDRDVTDKAFWQRLLDSEMVGGRISAQSPFVRFAMQPGILRVVKAAMGGLPQLDYVLLTLSRHVAGPLAHSQLWHRDHDDTRTIKIFVYLTDVETLKDGPFTFLPGPVSDRFGYSLRSHRSDEQIFSRVPPEAKVEMMAPAMTVFAVETSRCLHMGSRIAPGHQRLLYTATFTSFPKMTSRVTPAFSLPGGEDDLVRAVLLPRG